MRPREALAVVVLLVAMGCQGATLLTASDDMSSGPMSSEPNAVGAVCDDCFGGVCSWPFSDCAADPGCAGWLTCAGACRADGVSSPWTSGCVLACEVPSTQASLSLQRALLRCVETADGCCGVAELGSGGGGGGAVAPNAGGQDSGGFGASNGDGGTDGVGGAQCLGETCGQCLASIKGNNEGCTGDDAACRETMSACRHEVAEPDALGPCWQMASMRDCTVPGASSCGHELPDESVELASRAMRCVAKYCEQCAPGGNRACLYCQLNMCPDEMRAMWQDLAAQQLFWCTDACAAGDAPSACRSACWAEHAAGSTVVEALGGCTMGSCAAPCEL